MFGGLLSIFRRKASKLSAEVPPAVAGRASDAARPGGGNYLRHRPILDREQRVVAYELTVGRHRPLSTHQWQPASRKLLADELLWQFAQARLEALLEHRQVFLPVGTDILEHPALAALPRRNVVLQMLWHAGSPPGSPDTLAAGMTRLRQMGFSLACAHDLLDRDEKDEKAAALADYFTVDAGHLTPPELLDVQRRLAGRCPQKPMLAMNVDSLETYQACRLMRFTCFHGDFIASDEPPQDRVDLPPYKVAALELLNALRREASQDELAEKVWSDPTLVLRLLRVVNSPALRLRMPIGDLKQAIAYLGCAQLYRWVTLLLFSSQRAEDRQPMEYAWRESALVRGRFMELLVTGRLPEKECSELFVVGVLSMIDKLFSMPMPRALEKFNLPPDIMDALLVRQGRYASYLALAIACERDDQAAIEALAVACGLDLDAVNRYQTEALEWIVDFTAAADGPVVAAS